MFQIIILVASSLALAAAVQFTDCATDPSNAALTVHHLDFAPSIVRFPGDLHVTLNVTINKQINILFVDVVLEKNTLGIWTKVPCYSNIGTCQNIDACIILDKIQSGSSVISKELGQQIDAMLLSGLGHKAHCPIQPENLFINDYLIRLQPFPAQLSTILTGEYRIKISMKDDPINPDNLGCIQFQVKIGGPKPGASSSALAAPFQFTDCSSDPSYTALTVQQLNLSPSTITFPGVLHVALNLTINKPINTLFVDFELEKRTLGFWTKVPCIENIGSCQNVDFCTILDKILNGSSVLSKGLGQQIGAMLLSGLGHRVRCPIHPENLFIDDYTIRLQPVPVALYHIYTGDFRIRISVKDDPNNRDNLGCIKFQKKIGVGRLPIPEVG